MITMKGGGAIVGLFLAVCLSSCQSDKGLLNPSDPSTLPQTTDWSSQTFKNTSNRFDIVGQIHNEAMDYVISRAWSGWKRHDVDSLLASFYVSVGWALPDSASVLTAEIEAVPDIIDSDAIVKAGLALVFDHTLKPKALKLDTIIRSITGPYGSTTIMSDLSTLENDILATTGVDTADKNFLLGMIATDKYSYAYWSSYAFNAPPLMSPSTGKRTRIPLQMADLQNIVLSDGYGYATGMCTGFVNGGTVGAIGGAIVGAVGGPVGVLAGALAGGATGAVIGSIGSGVGTAAQKSIQSGLNGGSKPTPPAHWYDYFLGG
jgi:hypothetical protein